MLITTVVSLGEKEVEVSISSEDIKNALASETADATEDGTERNIARAINICAQFYKAIPDAIIEAMTPPMRKTIATHLFEQSLRFAPKTDEPS